MYIVVSVEKGTVSVDEFNEAVDVVSKFPMSKVSFVDSTVMGEVLLDGEAVIIEGTLVVPVTIMEEA